MTPDTYDLLKGRIARFRHHGSLSFLELQRGDARVNVRLDRATVYAPEAGVLPHEGEIVEISGLWEVDKAGRPRFYGTLLRTWVRPSRPDWRPPHPQPAPELEAEIRQLWPRLLHGVRTSLLSRGHVELLTPTLNRYFLGGTSPPLSVDSRGGDRQYLRVTSEIALKGHVAQRMQAVYEIGSQYRNTQRGPWQSTEFIALEAYAPFESIDYARDLLVALIQDAHGARHPDRPPLPYGEFDAGALLWPDAREEDLRRLMVDDACTMGALERACKDRLPAGISVVMHLPAILSPLYQLCDGRPHRSKRAWVCIDGIPVADLGEEEYVAERLRNQLEAQQQLARRTRVTAGLPTSDADLLAVVESGLPPVVGLSLSLSRVVAILTGARSIHDTHMRARPWRRL